jgi:hypothetical protein
MINPNGLNLDKRNIECSSIDIDYHIAESLGLPIKLPPTLQDNLSADWAASEQNHADLLALFELITGEPYKECHRDNTYNNETDLSSFAVFTVYAPERCADWCYSGDTFIVVEVGAGGDPRYSSYSAAQVYRVDSIADSGFLDWTLGYWLQPISDAYDSSLLDSINDRLSSGYSSYPYGELQDAVYADPVYCERRGAYVCRVKDVPYVCTVDVVPPYYGG